jgi:hypothetical protein
MRSRAAGTRKRPQWPGRPSERIDPEPVDYQHYEFYTFSTVVHVRGDTSGVSPAFE